MDVGLRGSDQDSAAGYAQTERLELIRQQQTVQQLAARDREVRAHEQAHAAVGGAYASQPHYEFTKGPNGVRYAVAGHVNIDVSTVPGDPAATVKKMETVARAALAPVQPSSADRAVAAKAKAQAAQARAELVAENQAEIEGATRAASEQPVAAADGYTSPNDSGSLISLIV